jgi:rhamnosyl/mannosyltransferase
MAPEIGPEMEPLSKLPALAAPARDARSLRILMIATEAPPVRGGIARIVGALKEGLQRQGHQVDILAYPEVDRLIFGEVRLSSLIFKFPRLLREMGNYDIVHVHGITPTVSDVTLLLTRLFHPRLPVVYTHHVDLDLQPAGFLNGLYNTLHHWLSNGSAAITAATHDTLALLGQAEHGLVIPFGIDAAYFQPGSEKDHSFTVLFVGQFRPWKGVRMLMQAMSQLSPARLLLAGHGPEEELYRALAARLQLEVEFHVEPDDEQVRQLYQRAHVVVAPSTSRLEAFGLALIEGMAAGCVPVAANLPGVREVVGPVGRLFPPGDTGSLAGILQNLRARPELLQQMSRQARVYARRFSQDKMISAYEQLFRHLSARSSLPVAVSSREAK